MDINEQLSTLINYDLEKEVVGTLILHPDLVNESNLKPEHFHTEQIRNILYIINDLHSKNIIPDFSSILDRAAKAKKVDKIGGASFISELVGTVMTEKNFNQNQRMLIDNKKKYDTILLLAKKMNEVALSELGSFQESLITDLSKLADSNSTDDEDGSIKNAVMNVYNDMQTEKEGISGASTSFRMLDEYLDGFRKQKLIIIGARPGAGKSAIIMNMAQYHSINKGLPSVVFSMEMSKEELVKRMISSVGMVNTELMRNPMKRFGDKHWEDSIKAMGAISDSNLHIFDKPAVDMAYIKSKCRMISRRNKGKHMLVFIDYLQLIKGDPRLEMNKNVQIGEISKALKVLSRELDCTVICLSQLGREVEKRQDKRPLMSDIRDSGQVEQDADVIGMLYRDDYYNPDSQDKDLLEFIVAKNRDGRVGTVKLMFKKEFSKISNLA